MDWQGQGQHGQECSSRAQGPSDEHQAPVPTPACSRARSGKFLLSASSLSPGLVQFTFSSFANLLLHSHATVVVQVLPSLPGEPHQAPKWFPSPQSHACNFPPALVLSLLFSNSFSDFPSGECHKTAPRWIFKLLGMAYQALWGPTLAPLTASFPSISLVPPDLCICWFLCQKCSPLFLHHNNTFKAHFGIVFPPALTAGMIVHLPH